MTTLTEEQEFAVYALDKDVLVSAGAGSGKTRTLVERYVQTLLHNHELRPANIIAVAFTRKAASEMRNRLKERLDELIQKSDNLDEQNILISHRSEIDSATIGTIHSLCESLLRAFPAQAAVDPDFQIIDELEQHEFIAESSERALLTLAAESAEVQDLLSSYPIKTIKEWIIKTLRARVEFADAVSALPGLLDAELLSFIQQQLNSIQESIWERIQTSSWWYSCTSYVLDSTAAKLPSKLQNAVNVVMRAIPHLAESDNGKQRLNIKEVYELLNQIAGISFAGGAIKDSDIKELQKQVKFLRDNIRQHIANVPTEVNQEDRSALRFIRAIISVHKYALDLYGKKKLELKKLDFDDQIIKAHSLLSSHNSTARKFYNQHLAAILVDEFQDTNRLQSQIIDLLAGPKTRKFLIGDDKQSIYKFQGADVSVFNLHKTLYQDNEKSSLPAESSMENRHLFTTFETSFRGHPELTVFLNNLFHQVLSGQGTIPHYHAKYIGLTAGRIGDPEPRVDLIYFEDTNASIANRTISMDAESVARWIQNKVQSHNLILDKETGELRPIAYGDFAVLLQKNAQFRDFELAFTSFELPYVCLGGSSFMSTQEVLDLENLLKFIRSPINDHALFGILRSPFFGFSDNMLQQLINRKNEAGFISVWETLKSISCEDEQSDPRILHALEVLSKLKELAPRVDLSEVLRQALILTGYDMVLSALPAGHQRSRNVWKFLARIADEKNGLSIDDFLHRLKLSRQFNEEGTGAPLDPGNSIKIITIHRAKGLEFPAVALPAMSTLVNSSHRGNRLLFHREYGVAFNNSFSDEVKPGYFEFAKLIDQELEIAEKRRLFYVAASRARDYLGIFIRSHQEKKDSFKKSESFQSWVVDALQVDFDTNEIEERCIEFHGSYGVASYNTRIHVPRNGEDYDSPTQSSSTSKALGSELLLKPIASISVVPESPWQRRLRATLKSPDSLVDGVLLGDYFHRVMEYVAASKIKPSDSVLEKLAGTINGRTTDANFQAELLRRIKQLMPIYYKSELYPLMSNALNLIHEVPYIVVNESELVKSKRPDLLLQDSESSWRIIDYKTDDIDPSNIKIKTEYREQVMSYVDDIKSICGIDASGHIYFARTGDLCPVV